MPLLHSPETVIRCETVEFDLGMLLGELYINMPLLHSSSLKHKPFLNSYRHHTLVQEGRKTTLFFFGKRVWKTVQVQLQSLILPYSSDM